VDFLCAKAKLVVELDGGVHETRVDLDSERDRHLNERNGWRVLRFSNIEAVSNLDAVLEKIAEAMKVVRDKKEEGED
jgi:very-short-patch-repair endonuclease